MTKAKPKVIYYTVAEVAAICKVTEWTVREWCKAGDLKASKPGRRAWRVEHEDLQTFLRGRHGE